MCVIIIFFQHVQYLCTVHKSVNVVYTIDCPEEVVMGVVWERSLTRITYKHKCSDIHPSFKLTDMVTRECMKNRSWAPVDVSQCVMDVDSPVVMILVMTLDTDSSTLVKSDMKNVIEEVEILVMQWI